MSDNVELKDNITKGYETGRIHSNLIRLQPKSFDNIKKVWMKHDELMKDLKEGIEQDMLAGENISDIEKNVLDKTTVIARLENDIINTLARESVPSDFVKTRAIKLKKEMFDETYKNALSAYSEKTVEKENIEDSANDHGFADFDNTTYSVEPTNVESSQVKSTENKEDLITREDITNALEEAFAKKNGNVTDKSEDLSGLFKEDDQKESIVDSPVDTVDRNQIEKETPAEENEPEKIRVSQNESTPARIIPFENNGRKLEPGEAYKEMTDEELANARENIEYERYNKDYHSNLDKMKSNIRNTASNLNIPINSPTKDVTDIISSNENVRDNIIVTPDRDEKLEEKVENKDENLSDSPIKETRASEIIMSKEDLEGLKNSLQEKLEQGKNSKEQLANAERELINATKENEDVSEKERIISEKVNKEKNKNEMLKQRLQEAKAIFMARLEAEAEDIRRNNEKRTNIEEEKANIEEETANMRANVQEGEKLYQETTEDNAELESMINDIYSAIGERAVNVTVVDDAKTHSFK